MHKAVSHYGAVTLTRARHVLHTLLIAAVVATVVGGCSSRFFYERIDAFVVWRLGAYVTLTDEQKFALKTDIQTHLDGLRENDLERIADLIDDVVREVEAGPMTAERFDARYQQAMQLYDEVMLGVVPLSERFLRGLSAEQIDEFFTELDEVNEEMYEEFLGRTPEERDKARNKSALRGIKEFTGRLSNEQKQLVTDTLARMEDASDEWVRYQQTWRDDFRALVSAAPEGDAYTNKLIELMVYPRNLHSPEYRARVDRNRVMLNDMLAELSASLTEKQQKRVVKELTGYVETLRKLAAVESGS